MKIRISMSLALVVLLYILVAACGHDDGAAPSLREPAADDSAVWSQLGIDLEGVELNAAAPSAAGFEGFVYRHDQWCYGRIPGAKILFVSEDGRHGFTLTADSHGGYTLPARPGRYRVYAAADGYEMYSTCNGFHICQEGRWQQSNIPLVPVGPVCGADGTVGGTPGYDPDIWPDRAPTATIEVDREVVAVGEPVTVRVRGEDDHHVVWLSWCGIVGCQPNGGRAIVASCDGGPLCEGTWEVSFDAPGRYVLLAHARDDLYPNGEPHTAWGGLGAGCVEVIVTGD